MAVREDASQKVIQGTAKEINSTVMPNPHERLSNVSPEDAAYFIGIHNTCAISQRHVHTLSWNEVGWTGLHA
jgi:hypothetical protein